MSLWCLCLVLLHGALVMLWRVMESTPGSHEVSSQLREGVDNGNEDDPSWSEAC